MIIIRNFLVRNKSMYLAIGSLSRTNLYQSVNIFVIVQYIFLQTNGNPCNNIQRIKMNHYYIFSFIFDYLFVVLQCATMCCCCCRLHYLLLFFFSFGNRIFGDELCERAQYLVLLSHVASITLWHV